MLFEAIKEQKRNHTLWTEILEAIRAKEKGITANNALNKLNQSRKRVKRSLSHWRKVRIVQALEEMIEKEDATNVAKKATIKRIAHKQVKEI